LAVETAETGGELRELLSTVLCCALFLFFFFDASVYCVYKHNLQLSTKSNLKLFSVVLRFNSRCSWIPQTVMCIYTITKHMTTAFFCKRSRNAKHA
jgi:hypothetical protein